MAIQIQNLRAQPRLATPILRRTLQVILSGLDCSDAEISLVCCQDAQMQTYNRTWRNKDRVTDVLSFPQNDGHAGAQTHSWPQADGGQVWPQAMHDAQHVQDSGRVLGDVVVCMPQAARQAAERGHCLLHEMRLLLVHGVLHLLGHDHVRGGRQAAKMRREELRLMALVCSTLGATGVVSRKRG